MEYLYSDITEKIIRAAMNVHSLIGNGFQEVIYQRSLEVEFNLLRVKYGREVTMPVYYKDVQVGEKRVDFLIEDKIAVELKAIIRLENVHLAQAKIIWKHLIYKSDCSSILAQPVLNTNEFIITNSDQASNKAQISLIR